MDKNEEERDRDDQRGCGGMSGPRPPVPGKEDLARTVSSLRIFSGGGGCGQQLAPFPRLVFQPSKDDNAYDDHLCGNSQRSEANNSGNADHFFPPRRNHMTVQDGAGPSSALAWADGLARLLGDEEGVQLLSRYLEFERMSNKPLMFWLACQGLKRTSFSPADRDLLHRRVKAIYRAFLRSAPHHPSPPSTPSPGGGALPVTPDCRRRVRDRINSASPDLDPSIFDEPQGQVEAHMSRTVYLTFLRSDVYLERLRGASGPGCHHSVPVSYTTGSRRPVPLLPTVHEDSELGGDTCASGEGGAACHRFPPSSRFCKNGANTTGKDALLRDAAFFYQPSLPYHVSGAATKNDAYATNVMPSALDSELQSMSSEAFSEEVASGSEISGGGGHVPFRTDKRFTNAKQQQQHNYEIQNMAATTNRCMGGSGGSSGKKGVITKHQSASSSNKLLKEYAQHNANSSNLDPLTFIPKMPQPIVTMPPSDPKQFVSQLTDKLNAVLRDREREEKLGDSMRRLHMQEGDWDGVEQQGLSSHYHYGKGAPAVYKMAPNFYPSASVMDDNSQSILDEHVSRVWKDSPPLQLPPQQLLQQDSNAPSSRHKHHLKSSPYRCRSPPEVAPFSVGNRNHISRSSLRHHYPHNQQQTCSSNDTTTATSSTLPPSGLPLNSVTMTTTTNDYVHSTLEAAAASLIASVADSSSEQPTSGPALIHYPPGIGPNTHHHYPPAPPDHVVGVKNNQKIYNWLSHTQKYSSSQQPVPPQSGFSGIHSKDVVGSGAVGNEQQQHNKHFLSYKQPPPPGLTGQSCQPMTFGDKAISHQAHTIMPPQSTHKEFSAPLPNKYQSCGGGGGGPVSYLKRSSSTSSGVSSLLSCPPGSATPSQSLPMSTKFKCFVRGGYDTLSSAFVSELEEEDEPSLATGRNQKNQEPVGVGAVVSGLGVGTEVIPVPVKETTVVGYYFCQEPVPYRTKLAGKDITLRQFKDLLRKKGNYRYYFKTVSDEFQTGVINEEISDDEQVLPLWEGKIFAKVEQME